MSVTIFLCVQGLACGALLYLLWFIAQSERHAQPLLVFFAAVLLAFLVRMPVLPGFADKTAPLAIFIASITGGVFFLRFLMIYQARKRDEFLKSLK